MTKQDIIKLLPAKREVYNEYDVENKTYNTALDDVTSALSKVTIPEMATEKFIDRFCTTCKVDCPNQGAEAYGCPDWKGSIPKPEGKDCDSKDFPACRESLAKVSEYRVALEKISHMGGFRSNEYDSEIERIVDMAKEALKVTKEE